MVVLLFGGHQEVDGVRERGVGDVVKQPGDLLLARCAQAAQQQVDPQAVLESGHVLEREGDRRRPGLADPFQPLEAGSLDQPDDGRLGDRGFSINSVLPTH